jgi:hypothetical protein
MDINFKVRRKNDLNTHILNNDNATQSLIYGSM